MAATQTLYRGYSIEKFGERYAIYSTTNSMYDCRHGFASIDAAKKFIDGRLG